MFRAALEHPRTWQKWRSRHEDDTALAPGRFRKGRRPHGCPRKCESCRSKKLKPTRHLLRSDLSIREWLAEMIN